ncbi:MAG: amino acid permease [Candidatus Eremiobacteraeota bacterium]|nr:amino acid permease [Candidatus Eremiobacteraeota bacterium]
MSLIRGLGLRGAVSVNVITMIGIGPLLTIPLVLSHLHGALALTGWIVGAFVAVCDGLVWAELGSRFPGSGGTYAFLRESFGRDRWGRMLAFLFTWQLVLSAPLLLATGYIGFAHYAAYLWPVLTDQRWQGGVAAGIAIVTVAALYRPIGDIGKISFALGLVAVGTIVAIVLAAAMRFSPAQAMALDPHVPVAGALLVGLGPALVVTLYDYYGYGQACFVGDEIREPSRVLPRAVVISVGLVATLYILLQIGVLGAVPWQSLVAATPDGPLPAGADYVASSVVERGWGLGAARVVTVAILLTAFASTFGNLLGMSRGVFAAARDGNFFAPFARLHARGRFPHIALLTVGLLAVPACFLSLGDAINALTAGMVIIQNFGQIAAIVALRRRGDVPPYRMWLFPLPALAATLAWAYIFSNAGNGAIVFGLVTLVCGVAVYLALAAARKHWPFAVATALAVAFALGLPLRPASAAETAPPFPTFGHSRIVERDGFPVFEVDRKPFFVYGAAFFYERLPRDDWQRSMTALKQLGINTLDLYVIWNWHELSDGDFDFEGRTSPRRDLRFLLKLARENGFKLIVRPGPVIRNEWRNGGYPAWLLSRPEYGMPQHDLLEGRYPPTATLQNAHSDDAAAEWMRNATHLKYSERWLTRALEEVRPYADLVLAVQLDDDQGAYLDNQTWPAPHLTAYLKYLESVVHRVTGPSVPAFINTYQMKVTASSPVWAMGNWYQSDAYSIGEHDRAQLELTLGMLQTRPHQPLMLSEFQAGWLLGPADIRPRPADSSNTLLAMTTALGMGVRGIVNFPAQDTLYPTGWEAPFANWFYAWDAALGLDGQRAQPTTFAETSRFAPTSRVGDFLTAFGSAFAASAPQWDAGIVLPTSVDPKDASVARVIELQQACGAASVACRLVDPRFTPQAQIEALPLLIVPAEPSEVRHWGGEAAARLARSRLHRTIVFSAHGQIDFDGWLKLARHRRTVERIPHAIFARGQAGSFLTVPNYGSKEQVWGPVSIAVGDRRMTIPRLVVPPHGAIISPILVHLQDIDAQFQADSVLVSTDCAISIQTPPTVSAFAAAHIRIATPDAPCLLTFSVGGHMQTKRFVRASDLDVSHPESNMFYVSRNNLEIQSYSVDQRIAVPLRAETFVPYLLDASACTANVCPPHIPANNAIVWVGDIFSDGYRDTVLENAWVRIVVAPEAGARAFVFHDKARHTSVFTTVGALRDDVKVEPLLSTTDRIAKYTHQMPAGMFNRPYDVKILESGKRAVVRFSYDAPDVLPGGAHFERTLTLEPDQRWFSVDERVQFSGDALAIGQRAVSVTSLAVGNARRVQTQRLLSSLSRLAETGGSVEPEDLWTGVPANTFGYYDTETHELATVAWRPDDVEEARVFNHPYSVLGRLTLAPGRVSHTTYGYFFADSVDAAKRQLVQSAADALASASR